MRGKGGDRVRSGSCAAGIAPRSPHRRRRHSVPSHVSCAAHEHRARANGLKDHAACAAARSDSLRSYPPARRSRARAGQLGLTDAPSRRRCSRPPPGRRRQSHHPRHHHCNTPIQRWRPPRGPPGSSCHCDCSKFVRATASGDSGNRAGLRIIMLPVTRLAPRPARCTGLSAPRIVARATQCAKSGGATALDIIVTRTLCTSGRADKQGVVQLTSDSG